MNQVFLNESPGFGLFGQFFIVLSFVAALFSCVAYFLAAKKEHLTDESINWLRLGRIGFITHAISAFSVFFILFYLIYNHYFEYYYVYRHSSRGLELKYLLSCFWEGGEGSFLLWIIWQALLGFIVIKTGKQWESRVMTIVALAQAILGTMMLGIYIGADIKVGSSPFTLLRNELAAPIFSNPNYLDFIDDGNGLNILLQNYWMVIHPPVLFLGFALTLFPFAYSIAAIWKGEYKTWIKPTLRWALMATAMLGVGIMLGGAWAYESLTFGGYWAWDPVENASLVPWLILIAGLHTLLIYKSTGRSLKVTFLFLTLTFIFVWYSTFLTRTGVLGDTSVHSFTGEGKALYYHLIAVLIIFLLVIIIPFVKHNKKMPVIAGEEEFNSREFWILIGSIFLFIASMAVIFFTSLPVWAPLYNAISGTEIAPPKDVISFYNNFMVWAAFVVALLSAIAQFFKYKKTGWAAVGKNLSLLAAISLVLTIALVVAQDIQPMDLRAFAFAIIFTLVANLHYFVTAQKGKLKKAGSSITHIGFGLMLLGILLSGYGKRVISLDRTNSYLDFGKETYEENLQESRENVLIFRNTTLPMGEYLVTYLGDSVVQNDPPKTYFKLQYEKRNPETNELTEKFHLYPNAFVNPKGQEGSLSANPDYKHYWNHDVFTYISSYLPPVDSTDTVEFQNFKIKPGDSIFIANGYLVFEQLSADISNQKAELLQEDIAVEARVSAYNLDGKIGSVSPVFIIRNNEIHTTVDTFRDLGIQVKINRIIPEEEATELALRQRGQQDDYVVVKTIVFPYIMVLWIGIGVMFIGFIISWQARRK